MHFILISDSELRLLISRSITTASFEFGIECKFSNFTEYVYIVESEALQKRIMLKCDKSNVKASELIELIDLDAAIEQLVLIGYILCHNHFDGIKENRLILLEKLEKLSLLSLDKTKIAAIVIESELFDATNQENVLNMEYSKIISYSNFYCMISARAKLLLN
jgi:hypothetical protein